MVLSPTAVKNMYQKEALPGGDGGNGGDVVFEVDEGLNTLMDFRYQHHFKAVRGQNGMNQKQHGKNAEPLVISVPPGTTVKNADSDKVIADLTEHKQRAVIAKGGRGGRGNARFANPRNPAPEIAENGEPGEELDVVVELKLLADVGLVGFPSVGKSTFPFGRHGCTPENCRLSFYDPGAQFRRRGKSGPQKLRDGGSSRTD